MKFLVRWVDCEEVVAVETVGTVAMMDILKAHKFDESSACLLLCRMVAGYPIKILDMFGNDLIIEKVEG